MKKKIIVSMFDVRCVPVYFLMILIKYIFPQSMLLFHASIKKPSRGT